MPTISEVMRAAVPAGTSVAQWLAARRGLNNATNTITAGARTAGVGIGSATNQAIRQQQQAIEEQRRLRAESVDEQRRLRGESVTRNAPYATLGEHGAAGLQDLIDNPRTFDPSSVATDPGYQFGLSEGFKGRDRAAQSRGTLGNGGQVRAQTRYALDYATTKYDEAFQRFRQTQGDRKDLLTAGVGIGQTANAADQSSGIHLGDANQSSAQNLGNAEQTNATQQGNLGVNAAEDQATLELAASQANATNQIQSSNNTANTIGLVADAGLGAWDRLKKTAPTIGTVGAAGVGGGIGGAALLGSAAPIAIGSAGLPMGIGVGGGIGAAGLGGAVAPPALASTAGATGITGALGLGGGSGLLGLGAATIPVVGGVIAGGVLLAKHFVGAGRKQADKLTGDGGIQHAFEDTLKTIDNEPGYTAAQKWQSKVQAYDKLAELALEFAKKGKNQFKAASQMFDTIAPLFSRSNPLKGGA